MAKLSDFLDISASCRDGLISAKVYIEADAAEHITKSNVMSDFRTRVGEKRRSKTRATSYNVNDVKREADTSVINETNTESSPEMAAGAGGEVSLSGNSSPCSAYSYAPLPSWDPHRERADSAEEPPEEEEEEGAWLRLIPALGQEYGVSEARAAALLHAVSGNVAHLRQALTHGSNAHSRWMWDTHTDGILQRVMSGEVAAASFMDLPAELDHYTVLSVLDRSEYLGVL